MGDLISVIVPVYNSARYIRECAGSVLRQTYPCFELLLIDDGSGDGSRQICEELCREDPRVRLVCRPHRGVSSARNAGIKEAAGKYLFFLDSDDVIHPRLLGELYELQEKNRTVIAAEGYCRGAGDIPEPEEWKGEEDSGPAGSCIASEKALEYRFFGSDETKFYAIGGKMIRRSFMGKTRFCEKLTHGEDTLFLYTLILRGADISVLNRRWYCYRTHERGATSIYSVRACKSRHAVNRYIRDRELKAGRRDNALHWENAILASVTKWCATARADRDRELKKYARRIAGEERTAVLFSDADPKRKRDFFMVFWWYPAFRAVSALEGACGRIKIRNPRWRWLRRYRELQRQVKDQAERLRVRLTWKVRGKITYVKWLAREQWAKAWRIRNKVMWGKVWLKNILAPLTGQNREHQ